MGTLDGVKVIEMAGIGPGPFAGMMLADMGADVIMIERQKMDLKIPDSTRRGKRSIALNLKKPEDISTLKTLVSSADILFEGFRPGVMERLGIGPEDCFSLNEQLIYGRITGWGQDGPLAHAAGHDINYISLSGVLASIGEKKSPPTIPLNLIGDYGGGAMMLICGILAAYIERLRSGKGQVVDAAMTEGSALLMSIIYSLDAIGQWRNDRASNLLDGGAHFYRCYETRDGKYISVGAIEPQFYGELISKMGLNPSEWSSQHNSSKWPGYQDLMARLFKEKTRDEWCALLEGSDACFAPVLDFKEAADHPHNKARGTFISDGKIIQAAPAPRFSRTPSRLSKTSPAPGQHRDEILKDWL